jgi:transcriptional regulator of acetoin/glycerol metabolism
MPFFVNYRWPGNIRELENVIERIVLLSLSDELSVGDLPDYILQPHEGVDVPALPNTTDALSLEAVEKELILQALRKLNWNQSQTARHLGISRKTLRYRIAKHGIEFQRKPADRMSA